MNVSPEQELLGGPSQSGGNGAWQTINWRLTISAVIVLGGERP